MRARITIDIQTSIQEHEVHLLFDALESKIWEMHGHNVRIKLENIHVRHTDHCDIITPELIKAKIVM